MNFTCNKKDFANALNIVMNVDKGKDAVVFLHIDGDTLEMQATNRTIGIGAKIEVKTEAEGDALIHMKLLSSIVAKLPGEEMNIKHSDTNTLAHISSGASNFSLKTIGAKLFIPMEMRDQKFTCSIWSKDFLDMINKTAFSCSKDEARPVFTGCYFTVKDGKATMVATNTHRISIKSTEAAGTLPDMQPIIIPSQAVNAIGKIMSEKEELQISIDNTKIKVSSDKVTLISALIEGSFPEYEKVIPQTATTTVKVKTEVFKEALERTSIIAKENISNTIRLKFSESSISIISENVDIGKANEEIPADVAGEYLTIGFNARYLLDILKVSDGEEIKMEMTSPIAPCKITGEDTDFLYIVTPVRLKEDDAL